MCCAGSYQIERRNPDRAGCLRGGRFIMREEVPAYNQTLGIGFKQEDGDYLHTETLEGAKTFALWPLSQAAQFTPEGLSVGITLTPSMREQK